MAWNPLYLLSPFALLFVSIPLATFAVFTTWIAFSTLLIRVSIVYIELGVALVHSWLSLKTGINGSRNTTHPKPVLTPKSSTRSSPTRRRSNRHGSSTSITTSASPEEQCTFPRHKKSDSFSSLVSSGEPNRDYEGVGGWRIAGEASEEELWIKMNSRLELPAVVPERQRRHQRSLTGGNQRWPRSPEAIRMSPAQSRARTPTPATAEGVPEGYFAIQPRGGGHFDERARRKSIGALTSSHGSSARLMRATARHAGH